MGRPVARIGGVVTIAISVGLLVGCESSIQDRRSLVITPSLVASEGVRLGAAAIVAGHSTTISLRDLLPTNDVLLTMPALVDVTDSRLIIASHTAVVAIDAEGGYKVVGRRGDGPGEYRRISSGCVVAGDSIVIFDGVRRDITLLDGLLAPVRRFAVAGAVPPSGCLPDGRIVVVARRYQFGSTVRARDALKAIDTHGRTVRDMGELSIHNQSKVGYGVEYGVRGSEVVVLGDHAWSGHTIPRHFEVESSSSLLHFDQASLCDCPSVAGGSGRECQVTWRSPWRSRGSSVWIGVAAVDTGCERWLSWDGGGEVARLDLSTASGVPAESVLGFGSNAVVLVSQDNDGFAVLRWIRLAQAYPGVR